MGLLRRDQPVRTNLSTPAFLGQSGVDVAARVDADAVVMAAVEADEKRYVARGRRLAQACRRFPARQCNNCPSLPRVMSFGPPCRSTCRGSAVRRKYLDALVRTVGDVELHSGSKAIAVAAGGTALAIGPACPTIDEAFRRG